MFKQTQTVVTNIKLANLNCHYNSIYSICKSLLSISWNYIINIGSNVYV